MRAVITVGCPPLFGHATRLIVASLNKDVSRLRSACCALFEVRDDAGGGVGILGLKALKLSICGHMQTKLACVSLPVHFLWRI